MKGIPNEAHVADGFVGLEDVFEWATVHLDWPKAVRLGIERKPAINCRLLWYVINTRVCAWYFDNNLLYFVVVRNLQ